MTVWTLFDDRRGAFNLDTLNKLATKVGYDDIEEFIFYMRDGYSKFASSFNGRLVSIGGRTWIPVMATRTGDTDEEPGDAVLTLWEAYPSATTSFGSTKIYDNSTIRKTLTSQTGWWRRFNPRAEDADPEDDIAGMFAEYMVTPNQIKRQRSLSAYVNDLSYTGTNASRYTKNWGNDNVWLPSRGEIEKSGAWGVTTGNKEAQAGDSTGGYWTRSSSSASTESLYVTSNGSSFAASSATGTKNYRAAININLCLAYENALTYKEPVDAPTADTTTVFTYTGSEQTYTPEGFDPEAMDIEGNVHTDADTYTVTVTPKAGFCWTGGSTDPITFENFVINKATPTVSASDVTVTYGQNYTIAGRASSGGDISFTYYDEEGGLLSDSPINAGNYTVKVTAAETDNYLSAETTISLTINQKEISVQWATNRHTDDSGWYFMLPSYSTNIPASGMLDYVYYKKSDYDGGDLSNPITSVGDIDLEGAEKDYYAVLSLKPEYAVNYTLTGETYQEFSVDDEREMIFLTLTGSGATYDGNAHAATVTATDASGVNVLVNFQYEYYTDKNCSNPLDGAPTDAGRYWVVVKLTPAASEYKGDNSLFEFIINKCTPAVTAIAEQEPFISSGKLPAIDYESEATGTIAWKRGQTPVLGKGIYEWTFTPDSPNNYESVSGSMLLNFVEARMESIEADYVQGDTEIFTSDTLDIFNGKITITANYSDGSQKIFNSGYTLSGELVAGENIEITVTYNGKTDTITVNVTAVEISNVVFAFECDKDIYTSNTIEDLRKYITVTVYYNNDTNEVVTDYDISGELEEGDCEITLTYGEASDTFTVAVTAVEITEISVNFEQGDIVYPSTDLDTLKDWLTVTAYYNNETSDEVDGYELSGELTVGESEITITYNGFTKTITVEVSEPELDYIEAEFTQGGVVYPSTGLDTLKDWITVTAYYTDGSQVEGVEEYELSGVLEEGESEITVTYGGKDYSITVEVSAIEIVRIEVEFEQGGEVYQISSLNILKPWLKVTAYYNDESEQVVSDYELSGEFTLENCEITVTYDGLDKTISVEVTDVAIVSVEFSFTQDGVVYPSSDLEVLRQWLTVTATLNNGASNEITDYDLSGEFTVGESQITVSYDEYSQEITVEVTAAAVDYIEAQFTQGGVVYHTTELSVLKDWLTVTAYYTDGTNSVVTDYELSGAFTAGTSEITVTYGAEHTDTVTVTVDKVKVALPVYNGTLSYTGDIIKPAATDFDKFDEALMAFVTDKTVPGLTVGSYKAVFALTDPANYEWATARALKKSVFAAVVYEEVVLEDYETAVEWKLAKAKITATKADGALPVFASDSFTGSLADIVGLKYYSDEACTQEIPADELGYSTSYFVKAALLDTENFELDETAAAFAKTAFTYTTPEKQLNTWEKMLKFLTVNWLWFVIGAAALLFLIILICIIAAVAKKRRKAEALRLEKEERKEEERRQREEERRREEREERRMEREERMARMSQQQPMPAMMPQMMPPMMGQMPQMAGQQAGGQTMATGSVPADSAQLTRIETELAALKAAQEARELAEIKAEQAAMRSDINALRGSEQTLQGSITLDKLTELVELTVEKVLDRREKGIATAESGAAPVTAQVPPDAVMTTVTTTKIDTTKKPVQSAQNAAAQAAPAGRNVVRNFVAPMPVDDGRVFDVGGFYTPADPATDMPNLLSNDDKHE